MVIESSYVNMNARHRFASAKSSAAGGLIWAGVRNGSFIETAAYSVKTAINKDGKRNSGQNFMDSSEDLMARFSQSRSIRASSLENSRNLQAIHKIRIKSIGYLLHQMFWGSKTRYTDPLSALFTDYSNIDMPPVFQPRSGYTYAEAEKTEFSTEGKVITASGKEINFNVGFTMSRSFYEEVSNTVDLSSIQLTDPLVINLDTDTASVSDQKFYFDLDADGHQEQISQLGSKSGFLAIDKNGDGIINDGSELFGTRSGNGFADLAQYDQDGNGWIDEADEIFDKLLIWQKDENGNDVLRALGAAGVGAIYLGNANTEFSLNSSTDNHTNAVVRRSGMFLYEDGTAGTMQQIDFAQ